MGNCSCCGFLSATDGSGHLGTCQQCPGTALQSGCPELTLGTFQWLAVAVSPSRGTGTALGFLPMPMVRKRSGSVGNSPGGGCPWAGGAELHSSADKIVLLGCSARGSHPDNSPCPLPLSFPSSSLQKELLFLLPHPRRLLRALLCSAEGSAGAQIRQRPPSPSPDGLPVPGTLGIQPFPHFPAEVKLSSVSRKWHWR